MLRNDTPCVPETFPIEEKVNENENQARGCALLYTAFIRSVLMCV